jgi:predicted small lipoprotein YifL
MKPTKRTRTHIAGIAIVAVVILALTGCGGPISFEEAEEASDLIATSREEISQIRTDVESAAESDDVNGSDIEGIASRLDDVEELLSEVESTIAPPEPPAEEEMAPAPAPAPDM